MFQLGDIAVDGTAYCYFPTFDSDGASVTITGLAVTDIEIFVDGVATTRASDNGYALLDTDGIDFDGMVGIHGFKIDLSDNSDAGFYVAGSHYMVAVDAITVDSQTVRFLYVFTIGQLLRPTTTGRTLDVNAAGEAGLDLDNTSGTIDAAQLGGDCITAAKIADGAFVAANFAASSLDGKGDWNTTVPDAAGTASGLHATTDALFLDAAGIRSAVGLASANLDTQLADIPTVAEFEARTIVTADYFDPANDAVASVTAVSGAVGSVTGAVGSVAGNVDGNVTGTVGSNLELGPSEVNAEVVDALNVDTYAELGQGAPAATASLVAKIGYLFKAWRNKATQTADTWSGYNDAGNVVDQKATVSDVAGTATSGKIGSGP